MRKRYILKIALVSLITFSFIFCNLGPIFPTASSIIKAIELKSNSENVNVSVLATGPISYKVINMSDPYICLIVELYPAQLDKKAKISKEVNKGTIKGVRTGQFSDNPDIVRLVVDLNQPAKYEITTAPDKCSLTLQVASQANEKKEAIESVTEKKEAAKVTKAVAATEKKVEKSVSKKKETESTIEKKETVKIAGVITEKELEKSPSENNKETKSTTEKKESKTEKKTSLLATSATLPPVAKKATKVVQIPVKKIKVPAVTKKKVYTLPEPKPLLAKREVSKKTTPKLYDLEYDNVDITVILKELTDKSGKNIVIDDSVKGSLTISVKQVTLERALQLVLKPTGSSYKIIGNIIIISTPKKLSEITPATLQRTAPVTVQVIPITSTSAEQVKKGISDFMPAAPPITIDKRLNALVVRAPENIIERVKLLVKQLDQMPAPAADPESRTEVFRFNYAQAKDVQGIIQKWHPNVELILDERINGLVATSSQKSLDRLKVFIDKLDAPKRQVILDVKIVDITESGSKSLGVIWQGGGSIITTTFQEVEHTGVAWGDTSRWPVYQVPTYVDLPFTSFARTPLTFSMALRYLVTKGEAKIIATPKVVTLSGEKAEIMVGQHYPITYTDPRAGVVQAEYVDIAVKLKVTPTITPDGFIVADISPEISEIATTQLGSSFPETTTRSLKTNVIVRDGDTIILGGLYRRDISTTKNRIPVLGDIPIFGEFFKNTTQTSTKDELLIMITPRII